MKSRLVAMFMAILLVVGCSVASDAPGEDIQTERAVSVDVCKVQLWGAIAFERANERETESARAHAVAWSMAQYRVAQLLQEDPQADEEVVIAEAVKVAQEIYAKPELAVCRRP